MLEWPQLERLPAANDGDDPGGNVVDHPAIRSQKGLVRDALAACDLQWSFLSLDRLMEVKRCQLETLFANSSSSSRDAVLRRAERVLFQGLREGIECGAYDGDFLQSYNEWAAKLLHFLRFSPSPLSEALTIFNRNSASLAFEFEHGVEQLFGTVQQCAIRRILQDPNIIPDFLADYFDEQFLPVFEPLSESACSYARSLRSRWLEWCGKVVPLVYARIDENGEDDFDALRGRLQLSLAVV